MMMKTLPLLLLSLCPIMMPISAAPWDRLKEYFTWCHHREPPSIQMLIVHDADRVLVGVEGKYKLFDPYRRAHLSTRFAGKIRYVQTQGDGLRWGESFPGIYQLKIKPEEFSTVMVNGQDYEGSISIYDVEGRISIVNQLPIERYVALQLATQREEGWEPELLAAYAIALRTHAYYLWTHPKTPYWHMDATQVGYHGSTFIPPQVESIVEQTRGMIMSQTGLYERVITPFPARFERSTCDHESLREGISCLTLEQANQLARRGEHAAQILSKAFPGATIALFSDATTRGG